MSLDRLLPVTPGVPIGPVVPVLVQLAPRQVAASNQGGKGPLHRLGADIDPLLPLQLLLDLGGGQACVGDAPADFAASAPLNNRNPALDDA